MATGALRHNLVRLHVADILESKIAQVTTRKPNIINKEENSLRKRIALQKIFSEYLEGFNIQDVFKALENENLSYFFCFFNPLMHNVPKWSVTL